MINKDQENPGEPQAELLVTSRETLKVLADERRMEVLDLLSRAPKTAKQLAAELHMAQTKLYYHLNMLEEHGLIRVVGTRVVSGIIEKQYRTTAHSIRIDRSLLDVGTSDDDGTMDRLMDTLFSHLRREIRESTRLGLIDRSPEAPPHRRLLFDRRRLKLTPERAAAFSERLQALIKEFDPQDVEPAAAALEYSLITTLFPTRPRDAADTEPEPRQAAEGADREA